MTRARGIAGLFGPSHGATDPVVGVDLLGLSGDVDESMNAWSAGEPPLVRWGGVCRLFEQTDLSSRHEGSYDILRTCAVFDLAEVDMDIIREAPGKSFESPLPFPQVALCMGWAINVVDDMWIDTNKGLVGARFLTIGAPHSEHKDDYQVVVSGHVEYDLDSDEATVLDGRYTDIILGKPQTMDGDQLRRYRPGEQGSGRDQDSVDSILSTMLWDVIGALAYINSPTRFIVEEVGTKRSVKKGKIPRLHSRPQYIVLDKQQIHMRYRASQTPSDRLSPIPHLRRGHYRTLVANRYKEPGRRVWVREAHVAGNTVEWREGDRYYRVR